MSSNRIAILSLRNMENHISRACGYEFEDTIATSLDDVDIFAPTHSKWSSQIARAKVAFSRHSSISMPWGVGSAHTSIKNDYDMFFLSVAQPRDLCLLSEVPNWRKKSKFAVCWLQELWAADISKLGKILDVLNQFDHVICPFFHSTDALRDRLNVPVTYLPWSVDTQLFCPAPKRPKRSIDILNIGGVGAKTHDALIDFSDERGTYYNYATVVGRHKFGSFTAHRRNYAGTLKRSNYFLSFLAKIARNGERDVQEEFGLRYLEGAAAGAILLGNNVDNPAFDEHLGWQDAVVEAPYDSENIVNVILDLEAEPERINAIRQRNVVNSLNRHDHLHRWQSVLNIAGLAQTQKMQIRQSQLAKLVTDIELNGLD